MRADLAVKIFGDGPAENRRVAELVAAVVNAVPCASQVRIEATEGQGNLNVRMIRGAMARFGIPLQEIQEALETVVGVLVTSTLLTLFVLLMLYSCLGGRTDNRTAAR